MSRPLSKRERTREHKTTMAALRARQVALRHRLRDARNTDRGALGTIAHAVFVLDDEIRRATEQYRRTQ